MGLTGRFDFRKTLSGKLMLLVEEDVATWFALRRKRSTKRRWRRARVLDLAAPEMRHMIDLRLRPSYQAPQRVNQPSPTEPVLTAVPQAERPSGDARIAPQRVNQPSPTEPVLTAVPETERPIGDARMTAH